MATGFTRMIDKYHENIQWIQILRGLAAASVALHHSIYYAAARDNVVNFADGLNVFAAGVDIFFVISGFVMMLVSDHRAGREITARQFVANRVARIVPLYWMYTWAVTVVAISGLNLMRSALVSTESVVLTLLFIPFRESDGVAPILTVGWTLNYEIWFYLAFALVIHLGLWRRLAVMAVIFSSLFVIGHSYSNGGEVFLYLQSSITFEFLAGMALYVLHRRGFRCSILHSLMLIGAAAALFAWSGQGNHAPAVRFLMWGIPAVAVVFASLSLPDVKGSAGRLLVLLGDASYSIYLSHLFTIGAVYAVARHLLEFGLGAVVAISFVASLVLGVVAYYVVERPLLRASRLGIRRWLRHSA
ncbi:exopolysaccharide production protein ExoZ [Inquilinus ginsengisoli]|uniref:acyltransferase family protein n=1 Tax=Inquilinus ginsengisoli TaxID=363840 RepID=UPI003D1DE761